MMPAQRICCVSRGSQALVEIARLNLIQDHEEGKDENHVASWAGDADQGPRRGRPHDGDKLSAADYAVQTKLGVGTRLGSQGAQFHETGSNHPRAASLTRTLA